MHNNNNNSTNIINQLDVIYLKPSRTIEEIELKNNGRTEICFIYNYEGNLFYHFESKQSLSEFLKYNKSFNIPFQNEADLDLFLLTKAIGA